MPSNQEEFAIKPSHIFKHPAFLCALVLVICVAGAYPILNMSMDDDWSYVWSARMLANTGHIVYNGWAAPILGWQLYLGALFIKLFGFSFTAVRTSMLFVGVCTVVMIQRLLVRLGISEWNSSIASLTIALSPLFLLLSFSFMSDLPGLFCLTLCLYASVRAMQAQTDRAAIAWLLFAAASNLIFGTARQIAWLGVLVIVPSAAWWMRRRRGLITTGAIVWLFSFIAILACVNWFHHQPYSISEDMNSGLYNREALIASASGIVRGFLGACLLLSPILISFLAKYPLASRQARRRAAITSTIFLLALLFLILRHKPVYWLAPFFQNHVTVAGGLLGAPPPPVPTSLRIALTLVAFTGLIAFTLFLWNASTLKTRVLQTEIQLSPKALFTLLAPFTLGYLFLLATQETVYERYLLPLILVALILLLRLYQQKVADRLPAASLVIIAFLAAYGIATMHDLFAGDRARVVAAESIRAAGVPRTAIHAGLEYDAWTQLEIAGHVNNPRIRIPAGAFHPWTPPPTFTSECRFGFSSQTPAIVAQYLLSSGPTSCFTPSQFPPVRYTTWLPPHDRAIYIQSLMPDSDLLGSKIGH
jgi:4-amino-4-deoxy-L-arabinose transferase-like glycosyltransferase